MEIVDFLASRGFPVKKQGRTWGSPICPNCGPSHRHSNKLCIFIGNDNRERWYCHACGSRGDLADLIAMVDGVPLKEALRNVAKTGEPVAKPATRSATVEIKEIHQRLLDNLPKWQEAPARYLMKRGIRRETITEAAERGLLRMLPPDPVTARDLLLRAAGGAKRLIDAGLWAGRSSEWPAQAFRPLVFFFGGTSSEWRLIEPNSQYPKAIRLGTLTKPMVWRADPAEVVVVEGAIDLLSRVEMGEKRTIMALPGVNAWRIEWFVAAHQAYGSRFVIALDDDEAGNRMADRMMAELRDRGIDSQRLVPTNGKDWNEMLVAADGLMAA